MVGFPFHFLLCYSTFVLAICVVATVAMPSYSNMMHAG